MSTAASSSAGPSSGSSRTQTTKLNPHSAVFFAPPEQHQPLQSPFTHFDRPSHSHQQQQQQPHGRAQPNNFQQGSIPPPPPPPNGYYGHYQPEHLMHYPAQPQQPFQGMMGGGPGFGKIGGWQQPHDQQQQQQHYYGNNNNFNGIHHQGNHFNSRPLPHQGVYFPIPNGPPVPGLLSPPPPPPMNINNFNQNNQQQPQQQQHSSPVIAAAPRPPSASPTVTPATLATSSSLASPSTRPASVGPPLVPTPELKQTQQTISFTPGESQAPPTPPTFAPPPASSSGRRTKPPPPRDALPLSFGPNVKPPPGIIIQRPVPVSSVASSVTSSLRLSKSDAPVEAESSATTPTASEPPSLAKVETEPSSPKSTASEAKSTTLAIPALAVKDLSTISTTATVASSQSSPILGPASPTTTTTTIDDALLPSTPKSSTSAVTSPGPTPSAAPVKKSWADLVRSPNAVKPPVNANGQVATPITEHVPKSVALQPTSSGPGGKKTLAQALEGVELDFTSPAITPRGLVNNGNLCFANAILQVLVYCAPFWNLMAAIRRETTLDLSGRTPSMDAMIVFLDEFRANHKVNVVRHRSKSSISTTPLTNGHGGSDPTPADAQGSSADFAASSEPFVPEQVYESLKPNSRFDAMTRGTQEDAEEFLGFFLDTLHEEILQTIDRVDKGKGPASADAEGGEADDWMEVGSKGRTATTRTTETRESPITKIFGGQLRSVLKCPGQRDSVTLEPYQRLQLDIQPEHVRTIEDALSNLTQPEPLPDYVTSRGVKVEATKQVFLESCPPVLILHLKRFLYNHVGGVQKSSKRVGFGTELEIKHELLAPNKRTGKPVRYSLYGVVYHHGTSASGGHYTVAVRQHKDGARGWLEIDDTSVRQIGQGEVVVAPTGKKADGTGYQDPYLLLYNRID